MPEPSTPTATKAAAQSRVPHTGNDEEKKVGPGEDFSRRDLDYVVGEGVARAASAATYERRPTDPVYRPLQVFTLDPATRIYDLSPGNVDRIIKAFRTQIDWRSLHLIRPVIITNDDQRLTLRHYTQRALPDLAVISVSERSRLYDMSPRAIDLSDEALAGAAR